MTIISSPKQDKSYLRFCKILIKQNNNVMTDKIIRYIGLLQEILSRKLWNNKKKMKTILNPMSNLE